jgi:hypothetical protein
VSIIPRRMSAPNRHDESTPLWKLQRDSRKIDCLVRLMPYGIEVDIAHDGAVILTRVFETDDEALAWAERKRAAREAEGWTVVASGPRDPAN